MSFSARLLRVFQVCFVLYVSIAVLYTTNHFFIFPLQLCLSVVLSRDPYNSSWTSLISKNNLDRSLPTYGSSLKSTPSHELAGPGGEQLVWPPFSISHDRQTNEGHTTERHKYNLTRPTPITTISESLFLSKSFAQSMQPSRIIPFFYRASGTFDEDDITLTTLVTSNRFKVFAELVDRYKGPISVTVHLKNTSADTPILLDRLHSLYTSSPYMSAFVDVHLVLDPFDRQFNTWRNAARLFARTAFVMMLDVDFAICTDFRAAVRGSPRVMDRLRTGNAALVVPAFEYVLKRGESSHQHVFPRDKNALLTLVREKKMDMFHASWAPGHNSTDYERYYAAPPGEVYKVTQYQSAYEPYVIFKKEGSPWCDERFVGYGGNKAACLFEMYLSGISYYVLADHFVVHQNHAYEEATRKNERKYNRKIYADFREETCLRYLKWYHSARLLNTTRGYNAQEECRKIKGVSRFAAQLIDG